jgi:hypothetical protein
MHSMHGKGIVVIPSPHNHVYTYNSSIILDYTTAPSKSHTRVMLYPVPKVLGCLVLKVVTDFLMCLHL